MDENAAQMWILVEYFTLGIIQVLLLFVHILNNQKEASSLKTAQYQQARIKTRFVRRQSIKLGPLPVADPGISGGGDINPAGGLGGAVSPPVGSRGEAPGHPTNCNFMCILFYSH